MALAWMDVLLLDVLPVLLVGGLVLLLGSLGASAIRRAAGFRSDAGKQAERCAPGAQAQAEYDRLQSDIARGIECIEAVEHHVDAMFEGLRGADQVQQELVSLGTCLSTIPFDEDAMNLSLSQLPADSLSDCESSLEAELGALHRRYDRSLSMQAHQQNIWCHSHENTLELLQRTHQQMESQRFAFDAVIAEKEDEFSARLMVHGRKLEAKLRKQHHDKLGEVRSEFNHKMESLELELQREKFSNRDLVKQNREIDRLNAELESALLNVREKDAEIDRLKLKFQTDLRVSQDVREDAEERLRESEELRDRMKAMSDVLVQGERAMSLSNERAKLEAEAAYAEMEQRTREYMERISVLEAIVASSQQDTLRGEDALSIERKNNAREVSALAFDTSSQRAMTTEQQRAFLEKEPDESEQRGEIVDAKETIERVAQERDRAVDRLMAMEVEASATADLISNLQQCLQHACQASENKDMAYRVVASLAALGEQVTNQEVAIQLQNREHNAANEHARTLAQESRVVLEECLPEKHVKSEGLSARVDHSELVEEETRSLSPERDACNHEIVSKGHCHTHVKRGEDVFQKPDATEGQVVDESPSEECGHEHRDVYLPRTQFEDINPEREKQVQDDLENLRACLQNADAQIVSEREKHAEELASIKLEISKALSIQCEQHEANQALLDQLERSKRQYESEFERATELERQYRSRYTVVQTALDKLGHDLAEAVRERAASMEQIRSLVEQVAALEQHNRSLSTVVSDLRSQNDDLALSEKISQLQCTAAVERADSLEMDLAALRKERDDLTERIEESSGSFAKAVEYEMSQRILVEKKLLEVEQRFLELAEQVASDKSSFNLGLAELDSVKDDLEAQIVQLQNEKDRAQLAVETSILQLSARTTAMDKLSEEADVLRQKLMESEADSQRLAHDISRQALELDEVRLAKEGLALDVRRLEAYLSDQQTQADRQNECARLTLEDQLKQAIAAQHEAERQCGEVESRTTAALAKAEKLQDQLLQLQTDHDALIRTADEATFARNEMQERLGMLERDLACAVADRAEMEHCLRQKQEQNKAALLGAQTEVERYLSEHQSKSHADAQAKLDLERRLEEQQSLIAGAYAAKSASEKLLAEQHAQYDDALKAISQLEKRLCDSMKQLQEAMDRLKVSQESVASCVEGADLDDSLKCKLLAELKDRGVAACVDALLKQLCSISDSSTVAKRTLLNPSAALGTALRENDGMVDQLVKPAKRAQGFAGDTNGSRSRRALNMKERLQFVKPLRRAPSTDENTKASANTNCRSKARSSSTSTAAPVAGRRRRKAKSEAPGSQQPFWKLADFSFGEECGKGRLGSVFVANCCHDQRQFAIKKVSRRRMLRYASEEQILLQIELMGKLRHPHILRLFGSFEDDNFVYMVLEYVANSTSLARHRQRLLLQHLLFPANDVAFLVEAVCTALIYLHKQGYAHGSVCPENVMIAGDGVPRLVGLGTAIPLSEMRATVSGRTVTKNLIKVSPPECLRGDELSESVDAWGLGVLAFSLLSGSEPFSDAEDRINEQAILTSEPEFPAVFDRSARDLILQLLEKDPTHRLPLEEVLCHPFIVQQNTRLLPEIEEIS